MKILSVIALCLLALPAFGQCQCQAQPIVQQSLVTGYAQPAQAFAVPVAGYGFGVQQTPLFVPIRQHATYGQSLFAPRAVFAPRSAFDLHLGRGLRLGIRR